MFQSLMVDKNLAARLPTLKNPPSYLKVSSPGSKKNQRKKGGEVTIQEGKPILAQSMIYLQVSKWTVSASCHVSKIISLSKKFGGLISNGYHKERVGLEKQKTI